MMFSSKSKWKSVIAAVFLFSFTILFFSCQKELTGDGVAITETLPDLTTKISSSISGFVTDENDAVVNGATVTAGGSTTSSNKYGYFEIKNVQVVQTAAVVIVSKPGYFNGIKTYYATADKSAFFRIKLIPKNNAGTFIAAIGGTVTLSNGLAVSFPANAVVTASSSAPYLGVVKLSAQWIDPTASDLSRTMPGDLRGLDSLGYLKLLTTYGMAAVELTGSAGELLQIATGKKATLTMPVPASISGTAPATIPLWYFDEAVGLWKQQGTAVKTGNNYIGEVSHFSYWNCDVPSNFVRFKCIVKDPSGNPVKNAFVKVSVVSNPQRSGWGYTDSSGYTGGAVPNNEQLLLSISSDYGCSSNAYTQNFTTTNVNIDLGTITIPASVVATVTGNVTNCSGAAVTNGYVIMIKNGVNSFATVNSAGNFSFTTSLCGSSTNASFIAEDIANTQGSTTSNATLVAGSNAIGTLVACGITTQQFLNYTVNGTAYTIAPPADSLTQYNNVQTNPASIQISGYGTSGGSTSTSYLTFSSPGIAVNSTQTLMSFYTPQLNDTLRILTTIPVNITEYGAIGQYMAGNFSGIFTGPAPANTPYNVTCNFRVRRSQ